MFYAIVILMFLAVVVFAWRAGTWSNILTSINLVLAGLVATSLFEPLASAIQYMDLGALQYLLDFPMVWFAFLGAFAWFSLFSGILSKYRVRFQPVVEMVTRTISAGVVGLIFLSFSLFTLHLAPLEPSPMGSFDASPGASNLLISPDQLWMSFARYTSRGSLSEFRGSYVLPTYDGTESSVDTGKSRRVFDSAEDFVARYKQRRETLAEMPYLVEESFFPDEDEE